MQKIHIIMPAFNEEEGLEKLLLRIKHVMDYEKYDYDILVVNDGSYDRTAYVLQSYEKTLPLKFISLKENSGITVVFQVAFNHVLNYAEPNDIIISLDSDNTQNPYAMIDMIKNIKNGADIVIASRFVYGSKVIGVPYIRNIFSNGVAIILGLLFPYKNLKDYSTFYRAYRISIILKATKDYKIDELIQGHGFSSMASFLLKLCYITEPVIKEVSINLRYDLKEGGSGIKIMKTIKGYVKLILAMRKIKFNLK